jgi:hypothetical protein
MVLRHFELNEYGEGGIYNLFEFVVKLTVIVTDIQTVEIDHKFIERKNEFFVSSFDNSSRGGSARGGVDDRSKVRRFMLGHNTE